MDLSLQLYILSLFTKDNKFCHVSSGDLKSCWKTNKQTNKQKLSTRPKLWFISFTKKRTAKKEQERSDYCKESRWPQRGLISWSRTAALAGYLQNTQGSISHQKASHISPSAHGQFIFMLTSVKNSQPMGNLFSCWHLLKIHKILVNKKQSTLFLLGTSTKDTSPLTPPKSWTLLCLLPK